MLDTEPVDSDQHDGAEEASPSHGDSAERIAAGDARAFETLFRSNFDQLHRYACRYVRAADEARDVVQDAFVRVWRNRRRIGLERDLRRYLYAIVRNHALDRLKHRRVEERFQLHASGSAGAEAELDATSPDADLEARELEAAVQRAVDLLPPRQREVLRLRWRQQLSYDEVAERLGISPKTVAIHVARALERLRRTLPEFLD